MSFWSTIAGVLPTLIGYGARLVGLRPGPDIEPIVLKHRYPPNNTREQWEVGLHRCYKCLRFDVAHQEVTKPPCAGKRPARVELA